MFIHVKIVLLANMCHKNRGAAVSHPTKIGGSWPYNLQKYGCGENWCDVFRVIDGGGSTFYMVCWSDQRFMYLFFSNF